MTVDLPMAPSAKAIVIHTSAGLDLPYCSHIFSIVFDELILDMRSLGFGASELKWLIEKEREELA
jgi:hypothetical protein